jgi:hypothetical protein
VTNINRTNKFTKMQLGSVRLVDVKHNGAIPFATSGQPSCGCHSTYSFYITLINFNYL